MRVEGRRRQRSEGRREKEDAQLPNILGPRETVCIALGGGTCVVLLITMPGGREALNAEVHEGSGTLEVGDRRGQHVRSKRHIHR